MKVEAAPMPGEGSVDALSDSSPSSIYGLVLELTWPSRVHSRTSMPPFCSAALGAHCKALAASRRCRP